MPELWPAPAWLPHLHATSVHLHMGFDSPSQRGGDQGACLSLYHSVCIKSEYDLDWEEIGREDLVAYEMHQERMCWGSVQG